MKTIQQRAENLGYDAEAAKNLADSRSQRERTSRGREMRGPWVVDFTELAPEDMATFHPTTAKPWHAECFLLTTTGGYCSLQQFVADSREEVSSQVDAYIASPHGQRQPVLCKRDLKGASLAGFQGR